jgi:hypothetical protein
MPEPAASEAGERHGGDVMTPDALRAAAEALAHLLMKLWGDLDLMPDEIEEGVDALVAFAREHGAAVLAAEHQEVRRKVVEVICHVMPLRSGKALDLFLTWYDAARERQGERDDG